MFTSMDLFPPGFEHETENDETENDETETTEQRRRNRDDGTETPLARF
jgi:hypothetical protein